MDIKNTNKLICRRSIILFTTLFLLLGCVGCGSPKVTVETDLPTINIPEATRQRTEYTVPTVDNSWMNEGSSIFGSTETARYILNTESKIFHKPDCHYIDNMSAENRSESTVSKQDLILDGYEPCGHCNP